MTECEGNASPPADNYDFDTSRVASQTVYLTALGTPCQYIHILDEDAFITPSGSEETELSSDESISSKNSTVKNVSIPPKSITAQKIKEEKLSDSEESLQSSKQTTKKAKKNPVVEYTDSEDSEEGEIKSSSPKARQKKHFKAEKKNYMKNKYSDDSDEDQYRSYHREYSKKAIKREEFEERELKYTPGLTAAFGTYHCHVCDITVNSEVTYNTHIQGKRHRKNEKAKCVPDLVMQSLNEPRIPPSVIPRIPPRVTPSVIPRIPPRVAPSVIQAPSSPVRKAKRISINVESVIQQVVDDYNDGPVPGLSYVVEIRPPVDGVRDISYNCELCEAKCVPNSIMKHLTGFKHYLRCLEKIKPHVYERYKYTAKKQIEGMVRRILLEDEARFGRGKIYVEKEVSEDYPPRDEPGPSWRDDEPMPPANSNYDDEEGPPVSFVEHLDTSMSDYYCTACQAHMNNQSMWESHVRGKRHLKNIKKVPGESTSKIKSVHCPGETAHIMAKLNTRDLKDEYGNDMPIVGLGYIKETQGDNGDIYNCYLCGACPSSFDIVDHLLLAKHKIRYLEEMNAKGFSNSIEMIKSSFPGFSSISKDSIINDECRQSLKKYGRGKIVVYKSKSLF